MRVVYAECMNFVLTCSMKIYWLCWKQLWNNNEISLSKLISSFGSHISHFFSIINRNTFLKNCCYNLEEIQTVIYNIIHLQNFQLIIYTVKRIVKNNNRIITSFLTNKDTAEKCYNSHESFYKSSIYNNILYKECYCTGTVWFFCNWQKTTCTTNIIYRPGIHRGFCIWPSIDGATITSAEGVWFLQSNRKFYIKERALYGILIRIQQMHGYKPINLGVPNFTLWTQQWNHCVLD